MSIIEFWRQMPLDKRPLIHPGDQAILKTENCCFSSYNEYIKSTEFENRTRPFHLGLLPVPYVGNIEKADIYILLLNPGFSVLNYYEEYENAKHRKAMERNLMQDFAECEFPLCCLDPQYLWTGGGLYWMSKLYSVLSEISRIRQCNYTESLHELSNRLAIMELIPYHSTSFGLSSRIENKLQSKHEMLRYVRETIVPKAESDNAVIIVTRQVKQWNLPDHANIVKYNAAEARSAHLTKESRGGQKILERIEN